MIQGTTSDAGKSTVVAGLCRVLARRGYAEEQCLELAELMRWEKRLVVQGIPVPPRHRPARFVAVEVTP